VKAMSKQFLNVSLLAFFFLALFFNDGYIYRLFFFAGVIPGVLWSFKKYGFSDCLKSTPAVFLASFIFYLSFNSFFVSEAGWESKFDQLRWGIELLFLSAAVILSSRCWLYSPRIYGRLFLMAVLAGGLYTLGIYIVQDDFLVRLSGNGFLSHPIQGPSTLLVLWSIGFGLYITPSQSPVRFLDHFLLFLSGVTIFFMALLSQSRGPVAAALVVFAFSLGALYIFTPAVRRWIIFGVAIVFGFGLYFLLFQDWLIDMLTARKLSYRPEIWSAVINNLKDHWLIGVGTATKFSDTVPGIVAKKNTGFIFDHAHNIFLQVWLSGGVLALFMLLGALASMIRKLFTMEVRLKRQPVFAGSAVLIVFFMVNLTDTAIPISAPRPDWVLFWLPLLFVTSLVSCQFGEKQGVWYSDESAVRMNVTA
tara:strand:+ start:6878 stop:8137 length:1260 start_codon:yes stop_codon:yes gene_type:complete